MKILFETSLTGHRLEYIHHLYVEMSRHVETEYTIIIPEEFLKIKTLYVWPDSPNVKIDLIPQHEVERAESSCVLKACLMRTQLLKRYVLKYKPEKIFLLGIMKFIPFLPIIIHSKYNVIGIIYKIYLNEWKDYSIKRKIEEYIKYRIITSNNCLKTVFILNDKASAKKLNQLYKTCKFEPLTDPFNSINYTPRNIRDELKIPVGNKVLLHFGGLQRRKGTLDILQALKLLSDEQAKSMTFIFAGKIYAIRQDFYHDIELIKNKTNILIFDKFCSTEFLYDLCSSCDCILMPYHATAQSSGLIAYAANFQKPVIGPSKGLIGKLIRKHHLGLQLEEVTPKSIAQAMIEVTPLCTKSKYSEDASIRVFQNQIASYF